MKALLLTTLLVTSIPAHALTCSITAADGKKYYKQTTVAKTLGSVALIKPCKDAPLLIPYKDGRGMQLHINPVASTEYPCYFLKVKENTLQMYSAVNVDGTCTPQALVPEAPTAPTTTPVPEIMPAP